jgi:acetyl-CoA synthetase
LTFFISFSKLTFKLFKFIGNVLKTSNLRYTNSKGILCLKQLWPGIGRAINGDHKRSLETYFKPFPGYYFTDDGAIMDLEGHIQITGRVP